MTIQEVIASVDELMPNQYSTEQKIRWLSVLDGKIWHEVIMTHHGHHLTYYPFSGYDNDGEELIVQHPFADDVYGYYLKAKISAENNEINKYDQMITLFNQAYSDWTAWYNRSNMPASGGGWRM